MNSFCYIRKSEIKLFCHYSLVVLAWNFRAVKRLSAVTPNLVELPLDTTNTLFSLLHEGVCRKVLISFWTTEFANLLKKPTCALLYLPMQKTTILHYLSVFDRKSLRTLRRSAIFFVQSRHHDLHRFFLWFQVAVSFGLKVFKPLLSIYPRLEVVCGLQWRRNSAEIYIESCKR